MASEKEREQSSVPKSGSISSSFFPPELKASAIKKRVLERFNKDEYEQLKADLLAYSLTGDKITNFFLQEGQAILRWSLIDAPSNEALKFLIETVSNQILRDVLKQDNSLLLRSFLRAQVDFERLGWYDQAIEEAQINKFKSLLHIDKESIANFVQENVADKNLCSDKVKANFENASKQFAENSSFSK